MKAANVGLAALLDSKTAGTFRHLVTITSSTGVVARWTDHAHDLTITRPAWTGDPETPGTQTHTAGGTGTVPLVVVGRRSESTGLEVKSTTLGLLCGAGAEWAGVRLPLAAIRRMFDRAWVKVERVFGEDEIDPSLGAMHVFEGRVASARPSSSAVVLDIESGLADLSIEIPKRIIQPGCPYTLGDTGCGLSLGGLTVTGTVASGATTTTMNVSTAAADGRFALGTITFTSGACNGLSRGIVSSVSIEGVSTGLVLDLPLPVAPSAGDTYSMIPGCDKLVATCETKFSNRVHFGGSPHGPKNEQAA